MEEKTEQTVQPVKKAKNLFLRIIDGISVLMIVLSIIVLLLVLMSGRNEAPNIFGYSFFRVMTGSMEPEIETDSVIIVRRCDPDEAQIGDVISFYSKDPTLGGAVNTHRLHDFVKDDAGNVQFETKGDANPIPDKYLVSREDFIGIVTFHSALIGKIIRLASNPLIFLPFVILPLAIILLSNLVHTIKLSRKLMKEEEEEALRKAIEEVKRKRAIERGEDSESSETEE